MKFDLYIFNSMYSLSSSMSIKASLYHSKGLPGGSVVKNLPANAGDIGSILGQEDPLEWEIITWSSIA